MKRQKLIAAFSLVVLSIQTFYPGIAYAVTSGPAQPEMQKFEPAGVSDMVDLFTGDFKQNIPLMDVGGYPINLSYQSGVSMEEEASWVGAGWTLNPGAVNRNMRGLPDDFNGDVVEKTYNRKPFQKVGGEVIVKPSFFGWEVGKASLRLGVYKDNYYGIGASFGAGINFQMSKSTKRPLTAGLGVNSDTRDGVDISPSLEMSINDELTNEMGKISGSFDYNTRGGLKTYALDGSFNTATIKRNEPMNLEFSATHYFGRSYTPTINNNSSADRKTFNFDLGPSLFGGYVGLGGQGYLFKDQISEKVVKAPAFGYINYLRGSNNQDALLDFNREKDGVFLTTAPSIAVPVSTQDMFMATGQGGSQQFRPFYSGHYVVFDKANSTTLSKEGLGVTIGGGNVFKGGGRINLSSGRASTNKWVANNNFLSIAQSGFDFTNALTEPVYFKQIGELTHADETYFNAIGNEGTYNVATGSNSGGVVAAALMKSSQGNIINPLQRNQRDKRIYGFSFLNAAMAQKYALDKNIKNYADNGRSYTTISRNASFVNESSSTIGARKSHHISEITVTDNSGKRTVYGLPVYNISQQELSFSVDPPADMEQSRRDGLINYKPENITTGNTNTGRDGMFSMEKMPSYATSFLLTGVLSPDYVDMTGDGITDDDLGTAVKFNYSKLTRTTGGEGVYRWRAPYAKANYSEGFLSDKKDDKASFVYGEKETWYLKSIESKTMIAIFKTSPRQDGLGVTGLNGGMDGGMRLKKLDAIELYSKADWLANPSTATPIKVVHFEYDYSLFPNMVNNSGEVECYPDPMNPSNCIGNVNAAKGKLTLRKVYFTFGTSSRGKTNPYLFEYDTRLIHDNTIPNLPAITDATDPESSDKYAPRQEDRWGSYKQSFYNRVVSGARGLNNSEFPYTIQENENTAYSERLLADRMASKWQLTKITTPTGGVINVEYESDDYAYVQNRRAMQMCFLKGIESAGVTTGLNNATKLIVELPLKVNNDDEFRRRYLEGAGNIFFKVFTDVDGRGHYEFIHGYAAINLANCKLDPADPSGKTGIVTVTKVDGYNPISKAAWQTLKTDLPQYAYDNYDNTNVGNDAEAAIRSIVTALGNFRELVQSFDTRAKTRGFANTVNLNKSMIRLNNPDYKKIGGGSRVHKLTMSDEWQEMSGVTGAQTASYGQLYDYTLKDNSIKDNNGNVIAISSGVAAYEPQIGNEENPFHEPVNFTEKVHWAKDKYHYVEKPYCESYFPAAQVGYRKVTVTSIGVNGAQETGYIENEFYTAKEFPVLVENTVLDQDNYENNLIVKLFSSTSINRVVTSQGFKVELNDMHGKPKAVKVYNKSGDKISSTEYFYNVMNDKAEVQQLDNHVSVLEKNGHVIEKIPGNSNSGAVIGTDIDFISDVRESKNEDVGGSAGAYTGGAVFPFFIPFYVHYVALNLSASITKESYHSISSVKVVHKYGTIKKVRSMVNGSTTEAENMVWDAQTGEVVLTKNQNEFDKYTYAFHYPAYMAHEGMSEMYRNIDESFEMYADVDGSIYTTYPVDLFPGDELVSLSGTQKGWVIKSNPNDAFFKLIDEKGEFIYTYGNFRVLRSGRRNVLNASVGTVVCMNNPLQNGELKLDEVQKILDSKAMEYSERWSLPVDRIKETPEGTLTKNTSKNAVRVSIAMATGTTCVNPVGKPVNPYYRDLLGVWRPDTSFVYTVNRVQKPGINSQNGGTDIRNSGYYAEYQPFWQFAAGALVPNPLRQISQRWVWSNRSVYYDQKGNETESVDALNRYSAALYGYQQSLATAIGTNARHNEIMFDGFEDYIFDLRQGVKDPCAVGPHFDWGFVGSGATWNNSGGTISADNAHTGKYSYKLTGTTTISRQAGSAAPPSPYSYLAIDPSKKYLLAANEQASGFAPVSGTKQLLSVWVYDGNPNVNTIQNFSININGTSYDLSTMHVPVVEGWKKLDLTFTATSSFTLSMTGSGGNVYVDDIRIMPFKAQMGSYVYDDRTLRLTAQLDENNFATLYEYDEEGTPVRVKKETERGIMTIKENRKSFRKSN